MKAYITKYALTQGIFTVEGYAIPNHSPGMFCSDLGISRRYFYKPYWHETEAEALAHADLIRLHEILKAHARIKKLQAMFFTIK